MEKNQKYLSRILLKAKHFIQFFFKENVRYPVWTCRDPIALILGTRIRPLKHLKKP